jgi:hypothetical protein
MGKVKDKSIFDAAFNDFKNGLTVAETCRKHPICEETFCKYVKLNGYGNLFPARNNTADYNYFKEIDSEEKAYFLGLIMADGYIEEKKNGVTIGLSGEEDIPILERFKECTQFSGKINEKKTKYKGSKRHFRISIYSKQIVNDLASYGIVPRKSLICDLTDKFPSKYFRPFFRGLFDGDGSVSMTKRGSVCCSLIGSEKLISRLNKIYLEETGLISSIENKNTNKIMNFGGHFSTFCFLNWIYENATIYLNRKYTKYLQIKKETESRLNEMYYSYCGLTDKNSHILKSAEMLNMEIDRQNVCLLSKKDQKNMISLFLQIGKIQETMKRTGYSYRLVKRIINNNNLESKFNKFNSYKDV